MELLIVVLKTIFFYFFILIIYRIMGKREIGQLSIQDLVVSILIAEMVAISIENKTDPLAYTVFPIIVLVLLEIVMAFISLKCNKIRHIIEGKPALIINKGVINFKEMVKQRYTLDDLLLELRTNKIKNLMDVEYAVLENNGKYEIGITDYAIEQLGDIVFVELPEVGTEFTKNEAFATIESVKAASEIYMPISGKVVEINEQIVDSPELLNDESFEDKWFVKIESDADQVEFADLLDYSDYKEEIE